jgi:hypothetical protein
MRVASASAIAAIAFLERLHNPAAGNSKQILRAAKEEELDYLHTLLHG